MRAAIYTRISQDDGSGLGVARQERDCRDLCIQRGWDITQVIVDNDTSAYRGRRPGYQQLIGLIDQGHVDALVVWHPDRLHRSLKELEQFIDLVERTNLAVVSVTAGDYDLATPEGRLAARIIGSVARKESEDKSRRLRRKHLELAENGQVSGGGRRPFGYEPDKLTVRADEAALIREAASRILAGESLRGVVRDWQDRGIPTVTGAAWQPTTLKRLLTSPRVAGLRQHLGRTYPASWPAIIDPDDSLRLRALLANPGPGGEARTYLLSGLLRCGRCDHPMIAGPVRRKGIRYPRYVCRADRGGCGRCGIAGVPLEAQVTAAALDVLASPLPRPNPQRVDTSAVEALEGRMVELADLFAAGHISQTEWLAARSGIESRLTAARAAVADQHRASTVPDTAAMLDAWPTMSSSQQRSTLAAIIDRIDIAPTTRAANAFDPDRVTITWAY